LQMSTQAIFLLATFYHTIHPIHRSTSDHCNLFYSKPNLCDVLGLSNILTSLYDHIYKSKQTLVLVSSTQPSLKQFQLFSNHLGLSRYLLSQKVPITKRLNLFNSHKVQWLSKTHLRELQSDHD
jgi:hypothetical protein